MVATVRIHEMSGPGTGTDKTSATVRFKAADNQLADSNNRLPVPAAAGTTISYAKQLQFFFQAAPVTDITNIRAYSDGTNNWTDITVNYRPIGTWEGMGTSYGTTMSGGTSFFGLLQGASLDMRGTSNHGTFTGTGHKGALLGLQMEVGDGAASGTSPVEVATFSYDES